MALGFVAVDLRSMPVPPVMKWGFVLLTAYTGPIGAFLYVLGCREPLPRWRLDQLGSRRALRQWKPAAAAGSAGGHTRRCLSLGSSVDSHPRHPLQKAENAMIETTSNQSIRKDHSADQHSRSGCSGESTDHPTLVAEMPAQALTDPVCGMTVTVDSSHVLQDEGKPVDSAARGVRPSSRLILRSIRWPAQTRMHQHRPLRSERSTVRSTPVRCTRRFATGDRAIALSAE